MLPLERFFNDQMDVALRMVNADDRYWSGFAFGLLGFHGGDCAAIARWHESLISAGNDTLVARGYRDGVRVMTDAAGGRVPYRAAPPAAASTDPDGTRLVTGEEILEDSAV